MDRGAWWAAVHGSLSQTWLSDFTFTFHFHELEKEMATHSSVIAWRIPGTEEPGRSLSKGSQRVGHVWSDLAVKGENKSALNNALSFDLIYTNMILETTHHFIGKCICIYACACTYIIGFPGGSDGKESAYNAGDLGSIPGLGRYPGGGRGNPLQYSCLENPHGQRSLAGYSPWGCKESDTTEQLSMHTHI